MKCPICEKTVLCRCPRCTKCHLPRSICKCSAEADFQPKRPPPQLSTTMNPEILMACSHAANDLSKEFSGKTEPPNFNQAISHFLTKPPDCFLKYLECDPIFPKFIDTNLQSPYCTSLQLIDTFFRGIKVIVNHAKDPLRIPAKIAVDSNRRLQVVPV